MMAMTPHEKKTLDEIESAFFEVVEPRIAQAALAKKQQQDKTTKAPCRRGWFGGLKEKVVMTFVCCAPPQTLLDDDEIQEMLAAIEEPVKPSASLLPRASSRKDTLMRRNSASVMPASRVVDPIPTTLEKASLSDITHMLDRSDKPIDKEETPTEEVECAVPRTHVSLSTIQRVTVTLLALHKTVETRQTERAVLAVQMKWRRRQITPAPSTALPTPAAPTTTTTLPTPVTPMPEPDLEPKTVNDNTVTSPTSPKRRRNRKLRCSKKIKFASIPHAVTQETANAVESLNELVLTRKRLRSVDLESCAPYVDVERDVHVLFGDEEIDEDDDEVAELGMTASAPPMTKFALQRCASVPPPPTAFRPRPVKTKSLLQQEAAQTIQRAWRNLKVRQEHEIQRRVAQYEAQKQSVMPTIRNKMLELRKRLEEMQERNSGAIVALAVPVPVEVVAPVDDDYDWL